MALNSQVLVLNRLWQAVNICSARRAFSLLYLDHAHVVHPHHKEDDFALHNFHQWKEISRNYDGHDVVHTIHFRLRIPKIILLLIYDRLPRKEIKFTRQNLFERDNYTCQYCGQKFHPNELNLDHVIPRDQGGKTTWDNIVCSCIRCNSLKGNRTPSQAHMRLLKKPTAPRWRPFVHIQHMRSTHDSWHRFLNVDSWKVELCD
ncbi:MAG: HNH endonuclease [Methylacidiphilales bacterium]|nr:HNH endonuclease [Candidatus Methylacidiphilales bacterium]MDW8348703.1 HNH endonuclease [Verrucomicrobiae bacterium]